MERPINALPEMMFRAVAVVPPMVFPFAPSAISTPGNVFGTALVPSRVGAQVATAHHIACRARSINQDPLLIEIVDDEIFYRAIRLNQIKARREKILHRDLRTIENDLGTGRVGVAGECSLRGAIDRCAGSGRDQQISRLNSEDVVGETRIAGGNVEHDSRRHRRDVRRFVERVIERSAQAS